MVKKVTTDDAKFATSKGNRLKVELTETAKNIFRVQVSIVLLKTVLQIIVHLSASTYITMVRNLRLSCCHSCRLLAVFVQNRDSLKKLCPVNIRYLCSNFHVECTLIRTKYYI